MMTKEIDTTTWNRSSIDCLKYLEDIEQALYRKPELASVDIVRRQIMHLEEIIKVQKEYASNLLERLHRTK